MGIKVHANSIYLQIPLTPLIRRISNVIKRNYYTFRYVLYMFTCVILLFTYRTSISLLHYHYQQQQSIFVQPPVLPTTTQILTVTDRSKSSTPTLLQPSLEKLGPYVLPEMDASKNIYNKQGL